MMRITRAWLLRDGVVGEGGRRRGFGAAAGTLTQFADAHRPLPQAGEAYGVGA